MKRKILKIALCICLGASLIGCSGTAKYKSQTSDATYKINSEDDRFLKIESINGWIYVDKETKVQYLFVKRGYGGGLTVMLDSDGSPLLYGK